MPERPEQADTEHFDVLIVGAGLSGVGAACHLQDQCPGKTVAILEARGESGGTWDLFRYPGVRSDSDMYTLAYSFRPWKGSQSIVNGSSILEYIRETARERGIDGKIRFNRRVRKVSWSSLQARWTVEVECTDTGDSDYLTCNFLFGNTGYYRYDAGYTPPFQGAETFAGRIVHPQAWPEDLDYTDKRIVVIGSGATAVTLVPALAEKARQVTMLQRSPSYIASLPAQDPFDRLLRRTFSDGTVRSLLRWKNVIMGWLLFQVSRHAPKFMKSLLRTGVERQLPDGYDIDTHFTPSYQPWDQRLCLAPDGDFFKAIADGKASVITDRIRSFTPTGIQLESGTVLEADVIVTATGLTMLMLGGIAIEVDGRTVDISQAVSYKSVMICGVPNLAFTFGYTNASWTLKSDLAATYVCRLINRMDDRGFVSCTPFEPDPSAPRSPYLDLSSGYVERSGTSFPKQAPMAPWRVRHNYPIDFLVFRYGALEDGVVFSRRAPEREWAQGSAV